MQFTLQLITTESCNLACKYCYMHNRKGSLRPETLDKIVAGLDTILPRYNTKGYSVSYFGGEPLLNWELIEYATPIFKKDPRCAHEVIISNGLELTQDKVDFIKDNNLGFSCSFDGLWNNEHRPLISGESSFDRFFEKRELITQLTSTVKSMVHPANLDTMLENFEFFVEKCDMSIIDFSLVRDDVWSREQLDQYKVELRKIADKNIEYVNNGKFVMNSLFGLAIADIMAAMKYGKRPFSCYAGTNGMAFGEEGAGYPCARFYSDRSYPLYDLETQKFNEDNMSVFSLDNTKNNPNGHEKCQGCSIFDVCNTGCKFTELDKETNRIEPLDCACDLFHTTYAEALRVLEAIKDNEAAKRFIKQKF